MSIMPLFEFVLVMIGIGTFAILLTALVLTATARAPSLIQSWAAPIAPEERPPAAMFGAKVVNLAGEGDESWLTMPLQYSDQPAR